MDGFVRTAGERLTDVLQHADELSVLPGEADRDRPEAWIRIAVGQILLMVPPPHVSPPERRESRERQRVALNIGDYRVTGIAHLRAGLERDVYLRATRPFLPLTEATLASADGSNAVEYEVLIVNTRWAQFVEA